MEISARAAQLTPSLTLSIDSKAKAMKAEGIDVCGFGAGEPDFDTPKNIVDAGIEALRQGWTHYGPSAGLPGQSVWNLEVDSGMLYADTEAGVFRTSDAGTGWQPVGQGANSYF